MTVRQGTVKCGCECDLQLCELRYVVPNLVKLPRRALQKAANTDFIHDRLQQRQGILNGMGARSGLRAQVFG